MDVASGGAKGFGTEREERTTRAETNVCVSRALFYFVVALTDVHV